jgi:NADPH-dependent glutamate synthase beta subunit-like oxidoreductase/NAD-dependent dihydropyrimidine dehydrogenase PreA subunit
MSPEEKISPEVVSPPQSAVAASNGSRAALIIGAGIAGIQSALDLAEAGFHVYLVERESSIGGRMAQLDKTFPTLDCSSCILTPKMADVSRNPNITLMTCTEVVGVEGEAGAFHVNVEKQPRYVDVESCTGCGLCAEVCPVVIPSQFNAALSTQKAIYRRFPQAIPAAFVIEKRESPCKSACPAHIPVQGYTALIAQGKFKEALERIRDVGVPFAGTLGRVCYHPCESVCKRGDWDEPVAICSLKRFAYDAAVEEDNPQPLPVKWDEQVAVVGAGPAGLTAAYELLRLGYRVTVFDALPVSGGMMAVGIPGYRLPRDVLNHEIDYICACGADVRLNTPVGRDGGPSLDDLRSQYDAVFLAIGAHGSSRMNVPGEELPGVYQALPFLRDLNLGNPVDIGKRVVVIGGGNSAIDAARCTLRLGSQVTILYRRTRVEMPAAAYEVAAAEAEGIELQLLVAPTRVLEKDGQVGGIECIRMELGEPDSSGRRRPVPIPGSEFTLDVDTVIAAIGQTVESDGLGLETKWGRLVVERDTLQSTSQGIFAGGDAVTGPASVVDAIGAGIRAAESIHRYLRGQDLRQGRQLQWPDPKQIRVMPSNPVQRGKRQSMLELPPVERAANFLEVEQGFTPEQAIAEAQRCLDCAVCSECMQCVTA